MSVDASVLLDENSNPVADPLFYRSQIVQEDQTGNQLQIDFNELVTIPESARHLRTTLAVDRVEKASFYVFEHERGTDVSSPRSSIPSNEMATLPVEDPIYYVVTAIYYHPSSNMYTESPFSQEVVGKPLLISSTVQELPMASRQTLIRDITLGLHRSNPNLSVNPGSVVRDTFIDPFTSEAQRLRFIMDFLHRAQSFSSLLAVDSPDLSLIHI